MAIEVDNLKVEQVMNKDGDMVYQVFDMDIEEVLFTNKDFNSAMNMAETTLMVQQIKKN
jgi:hypothetical protein